MAKTEVFKQMTAMLGWHLETVIASIRQPEDFGGIRIPDEKEGVKALPDAWVKRVNKAIEEGAIHALAFLDEVSCAAPATQAALLRPVLEGVVGDVALDPEKVTFAAAANPPDMAAGGWDQAPPLANRWCHIQWADPTADQFADFLAGGRGVVPNFVKIDRAEWEKAFPKAKALVGAFIKRFPEYLTEDLSNDQARFPMAFGTPRTWERGVARHLATVMVCEASDDERIRARGREAKLPLIAGDVGKAGATEFCTWLEEAGLPDPEDVLKNPKSWTPTKDREDVMYAVLGGVVACATQAQATAKQYEERWSTAWEVIGKCINISRGMCAVSARKLGARENRPKKGILQPKVVKVANELKDVLAATGFFDI